MSDNYHDEAGPSFILVDYAMNMNEEMNECRALSFTANPNKSVS